MKLQLDNVSFGLVARAAPHAAIQDEDHHHACAARGFAALAKFQTNRPLTPCEVKELLVLNRPYLKAPGREKALLVLLRSFVKAAEAVAQYQEGTGD